MTPLDNASRRQSLSLEARAWNIRRKALLMGEVQGQGYIGQALDVADILAAVFFHALEYRAEEPGWEGRDRFLLSVGHYAIALYAALMEAGILPEDELGTYGMDGSRLPMSGMASCTPGMEISGGSLGQGLGIGVGMALALKRKRNPGRVYNLMSDGELGEGSTWEAVMSAAQWKLDNLVCIVDFNDQQADGPTRAALAGGDEAAKWAAFGWHAQTVDGNDVTAIADALDAARNLQDEKPRVIIANTTLCRGVDFLELRERAHFVHVAPEEWCKALAALEEGRPV
ncbi:transketolase [Sulfitobacter sp. LCG007]